MNYLVREYRKETCFAGELNYTVVPPPAAARSGQPARQHYGQRNELLSNFRGLRQRLVADLLTPPIEEQHLVLTVRLHAHPDRRHRLIAELGRQVRFLTGSHALEEVVHVRMRAARDRRDVDLEGVGTGLLHEL